MNIKKVIGSRITQARKARGLLIKDLAERTGLGATRISNWEQGIRSPGPQETKILANELQVASSWLLCLSDDPRGEYLELNEVILKIYR